ncbi:putative C-type mannose receptor 2 [Hypsibius exemplaris]|uniref:C-type mannose receptor 2 n=1 Tax=Hypsibius exemplaris TaxID=2072580 RepID=A0A1W0WP05_HYPEX|nr:putative C-type mannose receptor 2 [Hypsibius exemplaris]
MKIPNVYLSFSLLVSLFGFLEAFRCPGPSWVPRRGSKFCYFVRFASHYTQRLSWNEAQRDCKVRGGVLASARDQAELNFMGFLTDSEPTTSNGASILTQYWLGLSYQWGSWEWTETEPEVPFIPANFPLIGTDPVWLAAALAKKKEHRGYAQWINGSFVLKSAEAFTQNSWICKAAYTSRPLCKSEEGWHLISDNRCWKMDPVERTWLEAQQNCRAEGAVLAVPRIQEESDLLPYWSTGETKVWIGLKINKTVFGPINQSAVFFEDGRPLTEVAATNFNIFSAPNFTQYLNDLPVGDYSVAVRDSQINKQWDLESVPFRKYPSACQTELEKCPYGWDRFGEFCFEFHDSEEDARSWDDANGYCARQGGYLAYVAEQRIQDFLAARLSSDIMGEDSLQYYYIGYRAALDGIFAWNPTNPLGTTYTNWQTIPAPSNVTQCTLINRSTGKWEAAPCTVKGGFICQAHPNSVTGADITHEDFECDEPFEKYIDGCYLWVTNPKNWDAARQHCLDQRSKLVEIQTPGENLFIRNKVRDIADVWIGVRRMDTATNPQFPQVITLYGDGAPINMHAYTNFATPPKESFYDRSVACYFLKSNYSTSVYAYYGKWIVAKCTEPKQFFCYHRGKLEEVQEPDLLNSKECGPGWILNGASCYKIRLEHLQYELAYSTCQNEADDSSLLTVTSLEELNFIRDMINGRSNYSQSDLQGAGSYWMALKTTNCTNNWFSTYRDSANRWEIPTPITNWDINEPKVYNLGYNDCGVQSPTHIKADGDAKWATSHSTIRRPFICKKSAKLPEVPAPPPPQLPINITMGCPPGWREIQQHCYQLHDEPLDWNKASIACHATLRASLVSVTTESQLIMLGLSGHWIGLNSLKSPEAPRIYENTDLSPVLYTPWIGFQPANNTQGLNCVYASSQSISVTSCLDLRPYVCMADLQPLEQNPSDCIKAVQDPGCGLWGHGRKNKCYYMGNDPTTTFGTRPFDTFDGAQRLCQNHHKGHLIVINDAEEQEFLTSLFANWAADSWIGMREQRNEHWNSFGRWINGDEVTVQNWAKNEPRSLEGRTGCVALHSFRSEDNLPGDWYVAKCEDLKFAVCEGPREGYESSTAPPTPAPVGCPRGWTSSAAPSRNCYKAFFADNEIEEQRTWRAAENYCQLFGGHAASVRSESEQATVFALIQKDVNSQNEYEYWLGLNESPNLASGSLIPVWKWADGAPLSTNPYFHPTIDHSSTGLLNYDCVAMDVKTGHWIKQSCHLVAGWVCEVPKGLYTEGSETGVAPPTLTPPTMHSNDSCARGEPLPGKWFYDAYTDHCFFLSTEMDSWNNSQTRCLSIGSNLATIAQIEQVFVTSLLSHQFPVDSQVFIGLHVSSNESEGFRWIDGSRLTYNLWESQPDPSRQKACISVNSRNGKWRTDYCYEKFHYLCLADKNIDRPSIPTTPGSTLTTATQLQRLLHNGFWDRSRGGAIAGAAVAILVIVPALTYLLFVIWRRRTGPIPIGARSRNKKSDDLQPVVDDTHDESFS